ncbi:hypothetical protein V8E36_000809 [Tilletia maclaganii]
MRFLRILACSAFLSLTTSALAGSLGPGLVPSAHVQALVRRQAPPNTVYQRYPDKETASLNFTFLIVPAPVAIARKIAGEFPLFGREQWDLPEDVKATIGEDEHPLFAVAYYSRDVHYASAPAIPELSSAQTYVGFVDCTGDKRTACYRSQKNYFDLLITAVAGTLTAGVRSESGLFDPPHSPFKPLGSGRYGLNVTAGLGCQPWSSTLHFASSGGLTPDNVDRLLEGPEVLSLNNKCLRGIYLYNETTTPIRNVVSDLELRTPLLPRTGLDPQRLTKKGVLGITGAVQRAFNIQAVDCSTYAAH